MQRPLIASPKGKRVGDAYERLKKAILTNAMPPGFQAPEPEIAQRLGMSRTPVHEALIRLEADGLIEVIPRHGARVLPIRVDDMREIYEILTALESGMAANLARSGPDARTLAPLTQATQDMETALVGQNLDQWAKADDLFHRGLLDLHGNQRLTGIVQNLLDQSHRARTATIRLRAPPTQSTAEHREILNAIAANDPDRAHQAYRSHRQRAAAELVTILNQLQQL